MRISIIFTFIKILAFIYNMKMRLSEVYLALFQSPEENSTDFYQFHKHNLDYLQEIIKLETIIEESNPQLQVKTKCEYRLKEIAKQHGISFKDII